MKKFRKNKNNMRSLIQNIKETKYRITMRQAMQKASIEELHICLEEVRKEINRRNEKK